MINKDNWEETRQRMNAFFAKDYLDRCCIAVSVPKAPSGAVRACRKPQEEAAENGGWEKFYLDFDIVYEKALRSVENRIFLGEAFPSFMPYFGTAGHAAYFGGRPTYRPDTIWFEEHNLTEPEEENLRFSEDNPLFLKHLDLTKRLSGASRGKFFIAMNDNCGAIDALAELRGSQNLLMDLISETEFVTAARDKILEVWKYTNDKFFDAIYENNDCGSAHSWMNTWTPGRHMQLQCDFSVMISPAHYEKFVLPELEAMTEWLDHANYHLDGQEQIRHLDMILSVKKIDNIQWTAVAGQPPTSAFIDVLQKIQRAGKGLILTPHVSETEFLMKNLSHKGLLLLPYGVGSYDEAQRLLERAKELAH